MGYRSDVRIVTSKKGFKEMKSFINKYYNENKIRIDETCDLLNDLDINEENNNQKYFGWNDIKWYNFPDIEAIEASFKHLKDNDYSYRFARMGEEEGDYEEYSHTSSRSGEDKLEYPVFRRYFDDDWMINNLNQLKGKNKEYER